MSRERPSLDGLSPVDRAKSLYQEALEMLDLALAASGSERIMLLHTALELRQWARDFEAMKEED